MAGIERSARFFYRAFVKSRSVGEDLERREYVFNIIALASIVMLIGLDASVAYYSIRMGAAYHGISFGAFSLIPLFLIGLYAASRRGFFIPASYLLIAAYFVSNSYAAYRWGLAMPAVVLAYALIIVIASILVSTRFGFFVVGVTAVYVIPLWYFEFHGVSAPQTDHPHRSDALVFAALYGLIAVVAWLSNREIERSLFRARRSEKALKEERDHLEITVRERTRELRKAELEKVEQLYRFAEFGRLASGLFHDILNLLNAVSLRMKGETDRMDGSLKTETSLAEALNTAKQIERFMHGIRRQLDRQTVREFFPPVQSVEDVIQLLAYQARRGGVTVSLAADPGVPPMHFGNPSAFHHVMMNVILNAIESYETVPRAEEERAVAVNVRASAGAITISVSDTGCGVPEDIREKIFEPFFTTKDRAKGLGIGLAMVKKIVEEDFHGAVAIESGNGKGTVFKITLPFEAAHEKH